MGALVSLSINQCNAAYGKYGRPGKSFSQADVDTTMNSNPGDDVFYFSSLFIPGSEMLNSYLNSRLLPRDDLQEELLFRLIDFLRDTENLESLKTINKSKCRSDIAVRFAEHLFSKLGASPAYLLNKLNTKSGMKCTCGCKTDVINHYGDTSLGNPKVWHGQVDIFLDGCGVPVTVVEDKDPQTLEIKTPSEAKCETDLEEPDIESQLLAQTIVFSFSQKSRHPEYKSFLIPFIGISNSDIIFHFYDSQHDILLKSMSFPIFDEKNEINNLAILATWFVVNYRFLCSGIPIDYLEHVGKANFIELADDLSTVYENELSIGCEIQSDRSKSRSYLPMFLNTKCNFVIPVLDENNHFVIPSKNKMKKELIIGKT